MNLSKSLCWKTLAASLLTAAIGCGPGGAAAVKTELVEGVVTLDGQAIEGATVTFVPVQEGTGAAATGLTDAEGKYRLTAVEAGPGAEAGAGTLPGEYYVGVLKDTFPGVPDTGGEQEIVDQESVKEETVEEEPLGADPSSAEGEIKHVVPQKFNDPRTSGIKKTVEPGKNDIPIELTSK